MRTPHHLAQGCVLEVRQTLAVIAMTEEQVPQSCGASEGLQFLDHWPHRPRSELHRFAEETVLVGVDVLVHEGLESLAQLSRLPVLSKVHGSLTYAKVTLVEVRTWGTDMTYQLKDQDVTPPPVDPALQRSVTRDAVAAVVMIVLTAGLIALIVAMQIV